MKYSNFLATYALDRLEFGDTTKYIYEGIYEVLEGKGKISHKQAVEKSENEYEKYKVIQDKNYVSDFDRLLSETKQIENK